MIEYKRYLDIPKLDQMQAEINTTLEQHLSKIESKTCAGSEFTGWYDFPSEHGYSLSKQIHSKLSNLDVFFDCVVVCGIGGSYLGTRAIYEAMLGQNAAINEHNFQINPRIKPLYFCGQHVCDTELDSLFEFLKSKKPIFVVISKSGNTIEPALSLRLILNYLTLHFGQKPINERLVIVTDQAKGVLRQIADEHKLISFGVPDDVGGRYSVMSAVGLVPLELCGFNTTELLDGASRFYQGVKKREQSVLSPLFCYVSSRYFASTINYKVETLVSFMPRLTMLQEWWKQLFGESEGKQGKGLFPASLVYSTDLHSMGQYMQDGPKMVLETFINYNETYTFDESKQGLKIPTFRLHSKANDQLDGLNALEFKKIENAIYNSTIQAHTKGETWCQSLTLAKADLPHIGYLLSFFKLACALSALMLEVNPFDQPGVEEYKTQMKLILKL